MLKILIKTNDDLTTDTLGYGFKLPKWDNIPLDIDIENYYLSRDEHLNGKWFVGISKYNSYTSFDKNVSIYNVVEIDDLDTDNWFLGYIKAFYEINSNGDTAIAFKKGKLIYQGNDAYKAHKMVYENFTDIQLIKQCGKYINFIPNVTEDLIKIAIDRDIHVIFDIENPSYELITYALKKEHRIIEKFSDVSLDENMQIWLLNKDWHHFKYFKNQTEKVQLLAVKKNFHNLQYCHNPSYNVMYEAVKNNGRAIEYVPKEKQTQELQLLAVEQNPYAIEYCHNPSYELIKIAVMKNGWVMKYVKPEDQTEELQLLVIKQDTNLLQYCVNPTKKVIDLRNKIIKKYNERYNMAELLVK